MHFFLVYLDRGRVNVSCCVFDCFVFFSPDVLFLSGFDYISFSFIAEQNWPKSQGHNLIM